MKKSHNAKWIAASLAGALIGAATISWAATTTSTDSPRYLSLVAINKLRQQKGEPSPVLQPFVHGQTVDKPMADLLTNPKEEKSADGTRLAQLPRPAHRLAPARVKSKAKRKTVIPNWVRYPLEFQLCGIGLGSHAVDKDNHNRIDRYGLFAIHGNPTAVVVPTGNGSLSVNQQPPEVAALFPGSNDGNLPSWAAAVTVQLDNGHVEWLYRRDTYSMGFIVDRLGFVDAIVLAGTYSPIGKTQLEDPMHSVKLGDDLRKVLYRYGYPDSVDTYSINVAAGTSTSTASSGGAGNPGATGTQGGLPPAPGTAVPGGAGQAAAAVSGGAGNSAFRTFELRYEQSYNIVFSIRNNRVVRIYIFGDPDFFSNSAREKLRTKY
ncbi:MAG: hypothetical protein ABI210_04020 [Abditibacteriaceae bacterium]